MVKKIALPLLMFIVQATMAQTTGFSTLRQVFNYSVGDSFEYAYSRSGLYNINGSNGTYYCSGYLMMIITSRSFNSDSLFFRDTILSHDTSGNYVCNGGYGYGGYGYAPFSYAPTGTSGRFWGINIITPDSLIFTSNACQGMGGCNDTAFADSLYNFHKQDQFGDPDFGETFADSIGLVQSYMFDPGGFTQYALQLVWYHKVDGEEWGRSVPVIVSSVEDLNGSGVDARLFPNPTAGNARLQTTFLSQAEYSFSLFDERGRSIFSQKIADASTDLQLKGFSAGLYIWQLQENNRTIKRGKLIIEE